MSRHENDGYPPQVVRQILVWVAFCAMAATAILGTLALVKC